MRRLMIGAVMVAMAFAGCGGDDNPTGPPSGSCCQANGTCTVTTQAGCTGTWAAGGVCEPNSCVQPDGSCCQTSGTCTVTKQVACSALGAWTMFGVCSPNPCAQPSGSCCALDGTCTVTLQAACNAPGTWTMFDVCSPDPCPQPPPPVSNYLPQTSPANVVANLQTAYAERRIDEYRKLFAEDFVFVFNPADPVDPDHPNPPQWDLAEELSVTENMFADELVSKIELSSYSLGAAEPVDYGDRAWKARLDQVNLQVYTRKLDGTLLTLLVEGATEVFFFREEPSELSPVDGRPTWYIIRWEDQPIGGMKTETMSWGRVKNMYR